MLKAKLILLGVKILMWGVALGLGIWYLSSSLSGASLTYTSVDNFLVAAGVQNGDIATANGCFMCRYVADLFGVLGNATEKFWTAMLDALWVIMVIGFGVFLFVSATKHIYKSAADTAKGDTSEKKIDFKSWFDKVWKQALRIMIVGTMIGALGMGVGDEVEHPFRSPLYPVGIACGMRNVREGIKPELVSSPIRRVEVYHAEKLGIGADLEEILDLCV